MIDITKARSTSKFFEHLDGSRTYFSEFTKEEEKDRASKIVQALRGLTIREAQSFLQRVSDSLTDAETL